VERRIGRRIPIGTIHGRAICPAIGRSRFESGVPPIGCAGLRKGRHVV
jgi:hypothetical protein